MRKLTPMLVWSEWSSIVSSSERCHENEPVLKSEERLFATKGPLLKNALPADARLYNDSPANIDDEV